MSNTGFTVRRHHDGTGLQLLITAAEDDEDEMASYCIVDEGHRVNYGGVARADLTGAVLTLEFTARAVKILDLAQPVVELRLELEPDGVAALTDGFHEVFTSGPERFRPVLGGELA